jgi:predicted TIM-barrel fold metal-dependent hydrolase
MGCGASTSYAMEERPAKKHRIDEGCSGKVVDCHIHLWSAGEDWVSGVSAQKGLEKSATYESFQTAAVNAGVTGALVIQHNFKWLKCDSENGLDHAYLIEALTKHPKFFRIVGMVHPSVGVSAVESTLQQFSDLNFVGVRINLRDHWEKGGEGPMADVAKATFSSAGKRGLLVGLYGMTYDANHLAAMRSLLELSPTTKVVIDHFGCFRQSGQSDEEHEKAFLALLDLALYPQVYVKVSGWKRISSVANGAKMSQRTDAIGYIERVVSAFTSKRTMWGSDAPLAVLDDGMPPGHAAYTATVGTSYEEVIRDTQQLFSTSNLSEEEREDVLRKTAESLFWSSASRL